MSKILIVHSIDANEATKPIIRKLRENDLDCLTYQDELRLCRLGSVIATELERMVISATIVLVFASPQMVNDHRALYLINRASEIGNLFTVTFPDYDGKGLPANFFKAPVTLVFQPGSEALVNKLVSLF